MALKTGISEVEKKKMQTPIPCKNDPRSTSDKSRVLIISTTKELPESLQAAADQLGLEICRHDAAGGTEAAGKREIAVTVLALEKMAELEADEMKSLTEQLQRLSIGTLVLANETQEQINRHLGTETSNNSFLYVSQNESSEMLKGRLVTLWELHNTIREMSDEMDRLQTVQQPLNRYFSQVDEEMRLAARLQRDFLPRELPELPGIRFATVFRPASWVSGDVYDVMRLDEQHLGFYVADAVGHGVPAALLTMFIKRALVTKRIEGHDYSLIEPGAALGQLNEDMVGQDLSNFQFATCCYCLLDTGTLQLRMANGGHPPPMLIDKGGRSRELDVSGTLLGVFGEQEYETKTAQLQAGDKLLLYSDGVEVAFVDEGPDKPLRFRREFGDLADYDIKTMCEKLLEIINREEGSLHPKDDVTIVGLEIQGE